LPIQNLCARMVGDAHRGEDLAQETFVRLYAKRGDYQSTAKFSTYLWRIALNRCYDELRRVHRRKETALHDSVEGIIQLDEFAAPEPEPAIVMEARERAENVRRALVKLPKIYRTVLILRHYENLKFREIADVLEIPEGTVKSRMAEAMTQLGEILRPAFADEPQIKSQGARS
jgi:RNA polymerase sigma-70 factor (ECF subfamily)